MRFTIIVSLVTLSFFGCIGSKHATTSLPKDLDGTWQPVSEEMGGKTLPKAAFEKQRLTLHDSTYTLVAESTDKGIVRYNGDKMDIYGRDGVNAGRHYTAIYKYNGSELTICYNLAGDSYPESFDTKEKALFFLAVFTKAPATWIPAPQPTGKPIQSDLPVR